MLDDFALSTPQARTASNCAPAKIYLLLATVHKKLLPVAKLCGKDRWQQLLLKAEGTTLTVCGGDAVQSLTSTIELDCAASLFCTIDGNRLSVALAAWDKSKTLTITDKGDKLVLSVGRSRLTLPKLNADEYPVRRQLSDDCHRAKVNFGQLRDLVTQVQYCIAPDSYPKLMMQYVHLLSLGDVLEAQASNGHCIAHVATSVGTDTDKVQPFSVLLPKQFMPTLSGLLDVNDTLKLTFDRQQVVAQCDGLTLASSLCESQFPDISGMVITPGNMQCYFSTNSKQLVACCERAVKVMASTSNKAICQRLALTFGENRLVLRTNSNSAEELVDEVEVITLGSQDSVEVMVNPSYLLNAVRHHSESGTTFIAIDASGRMPLLQIGKRESLADNRGLIALIRQ